jgi:membrane protease YdiL (CAAX protease family)
LAQSNSCTRWQSSRRLASLAVTVGTTELPLTTAASEDEERPATVTDTSSETSRDLTITRKVFWVLFAMWLFGKLCSIPMLVDTVPATRWLPTVPIGLLLAVLVIRASQFLNARTGLGLPFIEGWLEGRPAWHRLPRAVGLSCSVAILASFAIVGAVPLIIAVDRGVSGVPGRLAELAASYPGWWRGLLASVDAGISEELFYRYFLLSLVVWLLGRIRKGGGLSRGASIWIAVLVTGLLFGWAHIDDVISTDRYSAFNLVAIVVLNGGIGMALGWIYWRYGLESAMFTHFLTDALYYSTLLPALFFGGGTVLLAVVIVFLVVLALSILVFLRSGREVRVAPG